MATQLPDDNPHRVPSVLIARGGSSTRRVASILSNAHGEFSVVTALPPNRHLLDIARQVQPDIIVMALRSPFVAGIRNVRAITSELPIHVIVLCSQDDASWAVAALRAGAAAYLFDDIPEYDVLRMIRTLTGTGMPAREARASE